MTCGVKGPVVEIVCEVCGEKVIRPAGRWSRVKHRLCGREECRLKCLRKAGKLQWLNQRRKRKPTANRADRVHDHHGTSLEDLIELGFVSPPSEAAESSKPVAPIDERLAAARKRLAAKTEALAAADRLIAELEAQLAAVLASKAR